MYVFVHVCLLFEAVGQLLMSMGENTGSGFRDEWLRVAWSSRGQGRGRGRGRGRGQGRGQGRQGHRQGHIKRRRRARLDVEILFFSFTFTLLYFTLSFFFSKSNSFSTALYFPAGLSNRSSLLSSLSLLLLSSSKWSESCFSFLVRNCTHHCFFFVFLLFPCFHTFIFPKTGKDFTSFSFSFSSSSSWRWYDDTMVNGVRCMMYTK